MTEFSSCLSSLVFSRTRAGRSFLFQESLSRSTGIWRLSPVKSPLVQRQNLFDGVLADRHTMD